MTNGIVVKPNTVIPAVKGFKELEKALKTPSNVIFLLEGEIIQLRSIVEQAKSAKKQLFVHLDLIKGIKEDEASIHFLAKDVKVEGILTTRTSSLIYGKKYGLTTVQRGFLLDSHSMKTVINSALHAKPDYIELLPGFAYSKLTEVVEQTGAPVIMGGFIDKEATIRTLFEAGATAVSTSESSLWKIGKGI